MGGVPMTSLVAVPGGTYHEVLGESIEEQVMTAVAAAPLVQRPEDDLHLRARDDRMHSRSNPTAEGVSQRATRGSQAHLDPYQPVSVNLQVTQHPQVGNGPVELRVLHLAHRDAQRLKVGWLAGPAGSPKHAHVWPVPTRRWRTSDDPEGGSSGR